MSGNKSKNKILLIGPLVEKIGGTTISFEYLINELKNNSEIDISILSVKGLRGGGWKAIHRFIILIVSIAILTPRHDVISLQVSITAVPFIGPLVLLICKIFKRPLVFRLFGGMDYNGLNGFRKSLSRCVLKNVSIYLAQTKLLLKSAKNDGFTNGKWFPTARPVPKAKITISRKPCRNFVFIGHLRLEKGLKELAEAADKLPEGLNVHVWGPWEGLSKNFFERYKCIRYMGVLKPTEVRSKLMEYDCLILPTYLRAEGYSGVIFEAYSSGLPVIATRWLALPEIVIHERTGLLVNPKDTKSLLSAMLRLSKDDMFYHALRQECLKFVQSFSTEKQAQLFLEYCKEAVFLNQK